MMFFRDPTCYGCRNTTSGNCGMHPGPLEVLTAEIHVCPPPLTPAAQAVLDAAVRWHKAYNRYANADGPFNLDRAEEDLDDAIHRYREEHP